MADRRDYPEQPLSDPGRLPLFTAPEAPQIRRANGHNLTPVDTRTDAAAGAAGYAAGSWSTIDDAQERTQPGLRRNLMPAATDAYTPIKGDWDLVRDLSVEATNRLADAMNAGHLDETGRQMRGQSIIKELMAERVKADISTGREPWSADKRTWLRKALEDRLFRFGRFQPPMDRDDVENIVVIGCDTVWLDLDDGSLERAQPVADSDEELIDFLRFVANRRNPSGNERPFNEAVPKLHLSLEWDSAATGERKHARLAAMAFVTARPSVVIRRHRFINITLDDLVAKGMLTKVAASFLRASVRAGHSIVVSGPQGAGKTTMIRALCACIDPWEKIGTFETEFELFLHEMPGFGPKVIPWEARPGSNEVDALGRRAGAYSLGEAIDDSFRFALTRQIVGEVRGAEVWPMIKAMESGAGSISSTHGRNARATMNKLVTCAMEAGQSEQIAVSKLAQTVDIVVQIGLRTEQDSANHFRRDRWVTEIAAVTPGDAGINLDPIFTADRGSNVALAAGGLGKEMRDELAANGFDVAGFERELLNRRGRPS